MAEGADPHAEAPRATGMIRNPQDFYGGLVLILCAAFALWASGDLTGIRGFQFGPGTAPRMFAILLGLMGVIITLIGYFSDGPVLQRYAVRGPFFVIAAILFFAVAVRPLGLVITSFLTILISAAASDEVRWKESIIWSAALTLFCALLFPKALGLPLQLWPEWLAPYLDFSRYFGK
jgi:putative tricarboxylic transport membrane protein